MKRHSSGMLRSTREEEARTELQESVGREENGVVLGWKSRKQQDRQDPAGVGEPCLSARLRLGTQKETWVHRREAQTKSSPLAVPGVQKTTRYPK